MARRRSVSRDRGRIGVRLLVGVHDHLAADVPGGAADRLDQRGLAAQEALLVGVEDRDQRHLRQVEALAQEVHADEHVELAQPQLADDLDPLEGVDLRVQVADLHAVLHQVVGEVLGHLLRERGDERALARLGPRRLISFIRSSIWFLVSRTSTSGSTMPGRPDDLLDDPRGVGALVLARRGGHEHDLRRELQELVEGLRPVVQRARAGGSRSSTSVCLRERSPSYMPPICGTVWCDSSMKQTKSSGKKSIRQ